ncbi:hypothetical protein RHMOL_Rhmol08G0286500 [Rhododendron molle]|uniref:Uncharacterized protein n=1 Tax=Rhododendron molle TaxID=49168 RepID=A0ACC0MUK1_RHOML|nr:hypothetical protein RHMOL_Rhmol08G0286500 [Rhododendron molle]
MALCFSPTSVHQNQGWPRPHANFSPLSTNLVLPFSPHPHCFSPSNLNPRRSRSSAASPRRRRNLSYPQQKVQKQLLLGCKMQCRSSLPFYSGCPYSFGLQHGMEEMMIDQTRDLDLEDDLLRILLYMLTKQRTEKQYYWKYYDFFFFFLGLGINFRYSLIS